jgi:two-component system, NarL family, response regulator LiaR
MTKISVLIVDDHAIVRQGLRQLLDAQPDITVVGEAADAQMGVQMARTLDPDVILMDLIMPEVGGVEAIRQIINLGLRSRAIALTSSLDDHLVKEALQAGASGYLLKSSRVTDVVQAIKRVARGQSVLDPEAAAVLMQQTRMHDPLNTLTSRERDVFDQLARGSSNNEIASNLNISEITVRTHIANLLEKLSLRDRTQVVIYAIKRGLVQIDDLP